MNGVKKIFIGGKGIRSGWRFVIFIVLFELINWIAQELIYGLIHYEEHPLWHPVDFIVTEGVHSRLPCWPSLS